MRIALISSSFLPATGGAEFVVHSLAQEWAKQGHEVRIFNWLTSDATDPEATYSVRRFRLLRGAARVGYHKFPWGWYTRSDLKKQIKEFDPDCMSIHMAYPTGYYLDGLIPGCPYVITCHGGDLTKFDWGFRQKYEIESVLRSALENCSGAIAISSFARRLMEEIGVSQDQIVDIPNGVDLERFRRSSQFVLKSHFNLDQSKRVILSVGREHPQKAYAAGIRAFSAVAEKFPEAHYLLVGKGTATNQNLCDELNISDRVTFCEGLYGENLVGVYQQADIFFSPSIWEMMPLVVLEAMAAGRPAVVTNVSGSQDLVNSGKNGLVVEAGDIAGMSEALGKVLGDENLRESFSRSMLESAEGYSWDRISRLYLGACFGQD
jgi:glycosyltransferase involved in cell wall biosynthesis